ncbi:MFS transporter [Streptomyces sp. PTD5-9]|uniref:MFS transporter n=1 Tax=Streptomyces sp. PTD5-9 TaxID=3120150 RepID=UPI0030092FE2
MPTAPRPAAPSPPYRRSVAATVVGNFVESFDWLGYGLFAPLFAKQFFPSANPVTSLLGAFAVLGIGVLVRPLGGILLGRLADRRGRKPALMLAIALMTGGSLLIGVAPTYEHIGFLAPALLLLARIAQGVSSGGEWPAAAAYLMELAPRHRKCLYGSLFSLTTAAGAFVASLLGGALTAGLGAEAMTAWGWRVIFLVGGVFGLILLLMRNRLAETEVFRRQVTGRPARGSVRRVLSTYRRHALLAVLLVAGTGTAGGTWTSAVPAVGQRIGAPGTMFWVVVCATAVLMAVQIPLGLLADRVGAVRFLVVASVVFAVIGSYAYLGMTGTFGGLLFAYGTGVLYLACATTVLPKLLSDIFPPQIRGVGIGLPHALTTSVLGGVTPASATYLGEHGASGWFIAAVMATVLLSLPAALLSRSRAGLPTAERTEPEARPAEARPIGAGPIGAGPTDGGSDERDMALTGKR